MSSKTAIETDLPVLRQMVDSLTDYAMIRLDPEGWVQSWHPGAQRLKQYTEDEVLGHHFSMFYTDEDRSSACPRGSWRRPLATA